MKLTYEQAKSQFPKAIQRLEHPGEGEEPILGYYQRAGRFMVDLRGILCWLAPPDDFSVEWRPKENNWFFLGEYADTIGRGPEGNEHLAGKE